MKTKHFWIVCSIRTFSTPLPQAVSHTWCPSHPYQSAQLLAVPPLVHLALHLVSPSFTVVGYATSPMVILAGLVDEATLLQLVLVKVFIFGSNRMKWQGHTHEDLSFTTSVRILDANI